MNTSIIFSQRNQKKYSLDGFLYVKDKTNKDNTIQFWRCERKHMGCKARLWTNLEDGSVNSVRAEHTCSYSGNASNVFLQEVNTAVKDFALTTMENPSQIRARVTEHVPTALQGVLPSTSCMRRQILRVRSRVAQAPPNPERREDIHIRVPNEYCQYEYSPTHFERFLLADSGRDDHHRILIFGREFHSTWAEHMNELFMDGTFLLSPPHFSQIFVIMARKDGTSVFPILFCLLPDKRSETYEKLFNMIHELWPQLNPENINVDYELTIHQAIRAVFPEANINGCFFHLVQNLRKHLASCNLLGRYNTDAEFALNARMITSVAFVPPEDIIHAMTSLENYLPVDFEPILEWFGNTYIGRLRNNGTRAAPKFPSQIWSVYQRTLRGSNRTNNFTEACHRKLQLGFGTATSHPNIWDFINKLRKIQKTYDVDYERHVAGYEPPRKRRRYEDADRRILLKVNDYNQQNIIEYLRGISYNYLM